MTFAHLGLLTAGLLAVSIPIAIHLLMNRRRKPVMWGAMRFLVEAYRRKRRTLLIEKWLLLALRCLLVLLVALAIARPSLSGGGALGLGGGVSVYILLDNGIFSQARAPDGNDALELHKQRALDVVRGLGSGIGGGDVRVGLVEMGGPARGIVIPAASDTGAVAGFIRDVRPVDSATDLPGALRVVRESIGAADQRRVVVVIHSELRDGSVELERALGELGRGIEVLLVAGDPEPLTNVSIAGVTPLRSVVLGDRDAGGAEVVDVELRRSGQLAAEDITTVRVRATGSGGLGGLSGESIVRWDPGQERARASVGLVRGAAADADGPYGLLEVRIDDDAVPGDNTWWRGVEVRDVLRVGVVGAGAQNAASGDGFTPEDWWTLALAPQGSAGGVDLVTLDGARLDSAPLGGLDALVVVRPDRVNEQGWRRVGAFLREGGLVVLTPAPADGAQTWWDGAREALGVEWTLAREPALLEQARLSLVQESDRQDRDDALLRVIEGELEELVGSVRVTRVMPIEGDTDPGNDVLRVVQEDGRDAGLFLWSGRVGSERGLLVWMGSAVDLAWTDLPAKPLMVPMVQEIVRQGVGRARGSWSAESGGVVRAPQRSIEIVRQDSQQASIGVTADGLSAQPVRNAGVYTGIDANGGRRGIVCVHAGWRGASVDPVDPAGVVAWLEEAGVERAQRVEAGPAQRDGSWGASVAQAVQGEDDGAGLWVMLFALGVAVTIIEGFVARRASHADVTDTQQAGGAT